MSVGDGMSWVWPKFKENALILAIGMGLWAVFLGFIIEARCTASGEEHGFGLGAPFGAYTALVISLFANIVTTHMAIKMATRGPLVQDGPFISPSFGTDPLVAFLTWLAASMDSLLCAIPGIIAAFLFHYSVCSTVDKEADGIAGMKTFWATLSSHVGKLFPSTLTGVGLYILGAATLIDRLVVVPLVMLLSTYSHVRIQDCDIIR